MKPEKILKALIQGKKVRLTDKAVQELLEPTEVNSFLVHQIEQYCVNLYSTETDNIYYDVEFEDVLEEQ